MKKLLLILISSLLLASTCKQEQKSRAVTSTFTGGIKTPALTLGTTLISATGAEINRLAGVTDNIQQQLDYKSSNFNSTFSGLTILDRLQIGTSDSAFIIEGLADVGSGLTVIKDGYPITYNFPDENLVQIEDLAIMKLDSSGVTQGKYATGYDFAELSQRTNHIAGMRAMGSDIIVTNVGSATLPISGVALTDGRQYLMPVYLSKTETVTGIWFNQATQGDYTADNNNKVCFYSLSAGVLTLRASCANDGNLWKNAEGFYKKAFATPYVAVAGLYYAGFIYNQSAVVAAPAIGRMALESESSMLFTGDNKLGCNSAQTDCATPINLSDQTSSANVFWIGIY